MCLVKKRDPVGSSFAEETQDDLKNPDNTGMLAIHG